MTLNQVRKVMSETRYIVTIQLMDGEPPMYDRVKVDYLADDISKHARDLKKLDSAKNAKVTDIHFNSAAGMLEIVCILGE